jgi:hypothetical protein
VPGRILVFVVLALAACSRRPEPGARIDPSLSTLVPADTVLLVGTRLEALRATPVYQKYLAKRAFPQIENFAQRTGLDPQKDLWELLYVSNGRQGVLLGRGRFANEMEPKLEKEGAQRFGYKGFNLIGNEKAAVLFINSSTAAVGDTESLKAFLDQREKSNGPPPTLAAALKEIPPESQFWAVYTGGSIRLPVDDRSPLVNLNRLLASIQNANVYFDLRNGVSGRAAGLCNSDQDAQQVHDALRALVGLARLNTPATQPELLAAYDAVRVTQEAHNVKLYLDIPQAAVEKFIDTWMGRAR